MQGVKFEQNSNKRGFIMAMPIGAESAPTPQWAVGDSVVVERTIKIIEAVPVPGYALRTEHAVKEMTELFLARVVTTPDIQRAAGELQEGQIGRYHLNRVVRLSGLDIGDDLLPHTYRTAPSEFVYTEGASCFSALEPFEDTNPDELADVIPLKQT